MAVAREQACHGHITDMLKAGGGTGGHAKGGIDAFVGTGAGYANAAGRLCVDAAALVSAD